MWYCKEAERKNIELDCWVIIIKSVLEGGKAGLQEHVEDTQTRPK